MDIMSLTYSASMMPALRRRPTKVGLSMSVLNKYLVTYMLNASSMTVFRMLPCWYGSFSRSQEYLGRSGVAKDRKTEIHKNKANTYESRTRLTKFFDYITT